MAKKCPSVLIVTPTLRVECDGDEDHYRRPPGTRTRHRAYIGGPTDAELTWEDPL